MKRCHVDPECTHGVSERKCGHFACDHHTDSSNVCLICVDAFEDDDDEGDGYGRESEYDSSYD